MSSFQVHKFGNSKGGRFFRGHFGNRNHFVKNAQYFWHLGHRFHGRKSTNVRGKSNSNPVLKHQTMGETEQPNSKQSGTSSLVKSSYRRNYDMI
jgi:hypothetical protein